MLSSSCKIFHVCLLRRFCRNQNYRKFKNEIIHTTRFKGGVLIHDIKQDKNIFFTRKHIAMLNTFLIFIPKELSLWNKIKYFNLNIFRTRCCKPLIFQTQIIRSNRIHSLKYLRSVTFGSKDIVIRKSEFVATTQFFSFPDPVSKNLHAVSFINNLHSASI